MRLGTGEQAPDTVIRPAQLHGALKRSHGHAECTTAPCTCRRFLELACDVLVDAVDHRRSMPDAPIRVFRQRVSKCLVNASVLRQANLLTNR